MLGHTSPEKAEDAMWTVVRRVAPGWRFLSADLLLLSELNHAENKEVVDSYVALLKALGKRLFPTDGKSPQAKMVRARPEAVEIAALLASLASRPPAEKGGTVPLVAKRPSDETLRH